MINGLRPARSCGPTSETHHIARRRPVRPFHLLDKRTPIGYQTPNIAQKIGLHELCTLPFGLAAPLLCFDVNAKDKQK